MKSILIIEDDVSIRQSLLELLEFEGFKIHLAEHGEKGFELLKGGLKVDLILLDLTMPVMDGQTFLKEFKSQFPDRKTPIVLMTAAGAGLLPEDHPKDRILRKPMDVDQLIGMIQTLVP